MDWPVAAYSGTSQAVPVKAHGIQLHSVAIEQISRLDDSYSLTPPQRNIPAKGVMVPTVSFHDLAFRQLTLSIKSLIHLEHPVHQDTDFSDQPILSQRNVLFPLLGLSVQDIEILIAHQL